MLPVLQVRDQITAALRRGNRLVLTAPTGSGKSTQAPRMVLETLKAGDRVVVTQPRRLAARLLAARVAEEMGEALGEGVGFETRHERRVGPGSRIVYMTEGLLLRRLTRDAGLGGVGAVVLDEFHERSLAADIVLARVAGMQAGRPGQPGLKLVVMSATLDAASVAKYLSCAVIEARGRAHAVEVTHLAKRSAKPCWALAAEQVGAVLRRGEAGHVLVFMPGVYEINRTMRAVRERVGEARSEVEVLPLHGSLPPAEQDAAVRPSARRKVIVATNVAETSITIDGVTAVIDSGLARVHRYDAQRGINALRVEPISRASTDQRAGRAGRTAPGVCRRLWTEADHRMRESQTPPEVLRLELAEPMLQLLAMGVADVRRFDWLDAPEESAVEEALRLLRRLGAVGRDGSLTGTGRRMARLPLHPRLGRVMIEAHRRGCAARAATWAALVSEREIIATRDRRELLRFVEPEEPESDLAVRERALAAAESARFRRGACEAMGVHGGAAREGAQAAGQIRRVCRRMGIDVTQDGTTRELLRCMLKGFADHVAVRPTAERGHCLMPGRRRVVLDGRSVVDSAGPVLAMELREVGRGERAETVLGLASRIEIDDLRAVWPKRVKQRRVTRWNDERGAAEAVEQTCFGALVLEETVRDDVEPSAAREMLIERIMAGTLALGRWDDSVEQWITRARCVRQWRPERAMITYDEADRAVIVHEIVGEATTYRAVRDRPCLDAVRAALSWEDQRFVEQMAPTELALSNGTRLKLRYEEGGPPRGRARIQQLYDVAETPRVAGGRVEVLLEILAPNHRPVQITTDLAGFWRTLYPELRKELRRRYPKHEWR